MYHRDSTSNLIMLPLCSGLLYLCPTSRLGPHSAQVLRKSCTACLGFYYADPQDRVPQISRGDRAFRLYSLLEPNKRCYRLSHAQLRRCGINMRQLRPSSRTAEVLQHEYQGSVHIYNSIMCKQIQSVNLVFTGNLSTR